MSNAAAVVSYDYAPDRADAGYEITFENAEDAYSYDHIGNLALHGSPAATNAYTANNLNQYTSIQRTSALSAGETALTYDLDGNMTQCTTKLPRRSMVGNENGFLID